MMNPITEHVEVTMREAFGLPVSVIWVAKAASRYRLPEQPTPYQKLATEILSEDGE